MFKYFIFTYFMFKYRSLYLHTLCLNTLYLHQERVLSTEAAMFFTVTEATTGSLSCLEAEGGVRAVQLQHDT